LEDELDIVVVVVADTFFREVSDTRISSFNVGNINFSVNCVKDSCSDSFDTNTGEFTGEFTFDDT